MAKEIKSRQEEIRALDSRTLSERVQEEEIRLKKLQFSHAVNTIENPLSIRQLRRNIARMKTEQQRRSIGF